ncbi:MAG: hypothetical protein EPO55_11705 [Reyranella sp.]|uniref:hypothetical protein n=1 Tax=Reyranella sp. TaxID=1929291 RepID=UPI00121D9B49|nr:hypothetical protein [Reyranella sp.]TAJ39663.1 MAG: hypothetical protein EPO55_11705 [Reyranella sp.]
MSIGLVVVPSVTKLPPETDGAVLVGGSHGAVYAAYLSAKAGARAAIHNDAGIGLDEAGVSGLAWADRHGMAMAAVAASSARIGDGESMLRRGVISRANKQAAACGVEAGQSVAEAVERLKAAPWPHRKPEPLAEGRALSDRIMCVDSISLADARDRGLVVASGSHGGVPAGETAAAFRPALALFNDAGFGFEQAGVAGLAILDKGGIAGATVGALTARIGDGHSTLTQGMLSEVNEAAYRLGARVGMSALALALSMAEKAR